MTIKRVGIDLAKQVFQLHGVDGQEKAVLRKQLRIAYPNTLPWYLGARNCQSWIETVLEKAREAAAKENCPQGCK